MITFGTQVSPSPSPRQIETKAIELYGGPDARHGNPPLTYDELSEAWKGAWRKLAYAKLLRVRVPYRRQVV